ncbi:MAG: hypothetical protein CSA60_04455 [Neptuniibacter caesariensis]|uniref:Uncharacterized protein n=1 Tax=Neptuniibacter caesariensis TaxID=207954 RepID=A0A2G6JIW1_NEPCE|nr:MAG: hypothetical protein CSA60_04455 [Neptuniibacter caesariensis]
MNTDCTHCFELMHSGKEHPQLNTVSDLEHSQICKCGHCGAMLMSNADSWSIVIKGSVARHHKNQKRNAA